MLKRLTALCWLVALPSIAHAQSMSGEAGWTTLYTQSTLVGTLTEGNTTAAAIATGGTVYWGANDGSTADNGRRALRSRQITGRVTTLHNSIQLRGLIASGGFVYYTSDESDANSNMYRFTPGQVPTVFVDDFRPGSTGDDDPGGIELVPAGWTGGAIVQPGEMLVTDVGTNDVLFAVTVGGTTGTPRAIGNDPGDGYTLVDVAVSNDRILVADREGSRILQVSTLTGTTSAMAAITIGNGGLGGQPVGIEWDSTNNTFVVAIISSGTDELVRLTPPTGGGTTWGRAEIGTGFTFDAAPTQVVDISATGDMLAVANDNSVVVFARCGLAAAADCDNDDRADVCEVAVDNSPDCNSNSVPDACDISAATSTDCNSDNVPDECSTCATPVDMVFMVDTSGSMDDEGSSICTNIQAIVTALQADGITVNATLWGVGAFGSGQGTAFSCLTDTVQGGLPGDPTDLPGTQANTVINGTSYNQGTLYGQCTTIGTDTSPEEDWGRATSMVSAFFPWGENPTTGADNIRLAVPVSDEGAWCGTNETPNDGVNQADADAVNFAIQIAGANRVIVSPILASGYDNTANQPMEQHAVSLANATGGRVSRELAGADLVASIRNIVLDACVESNDCNNNGTNDLCDIQNGEEDCNEDGRPDVCDGTVCNLPPVANNDLVAGTTNVTINNINPAANDTDSDGTVVASSIDLDPNVAGIQKTYTATGGTFTANAAGVVTFVPTNNFFGNAEALYVIADDDGAYSQPARIIVDVNSRPTANNDSAVTQLNTPVTLSPAVTNNDTDPDGTIVPATIDLDTTTGGVQKSRTVANVGTFTATDTGVVTFTPVTGYTGTATTTYVVQDNDNAISFPGTISVKVNAPPVAVNDSGTFLTGGPVTLASPVTSNDTDSDGNVVASTIDLDPGTSGVQKSRTITNVGTFSVDLSGNVTFTPSSSTFVGVATTTYVVNDNDGGLSNAATITVTFVACFTAAQCENNDPCTVPSCSAQGSCVFTPEPPGTICPEGVCDGTGRCVECVTPAQCGDSNECTADQCVNNVCSNPNHPSGTTCTGGVCDGQGNCEECNDTGAGATVDQGCAEPDSECDIDSFSTNTCVVCEDDNPTAGAVDGGCQSTVPICLDTNPANPRCVECERNEDCGANRVCDERDNTCGPCVDTTNFPGIDEGCVDARRICELTVTGDPDRCVTCQLDPNDSLPIDTGCSAGSPLCVQDGNGDRRCTGCTEDSDCPTGQVCNQEQCVACVDTVIYPQTDRGCQDDVGQPICRLPPGAVGTEPTNLPGVDCTPCRDDRGPTLADTGCGGGTPVCLDTVTFNERCVECEEDLNCASGEICNETLNICVPCLDNNPGVTTDDGCNNVKPLCDVRVPDQQQCEECIDDKPGEVQDLGCSLNEPLCDESAVGGNNCFPCVDDNAQPGGRDSGCQPVTPFCVDATGGGRRCVECEEDDDCEGEELCRDGICVDPGETLAVDDAYRTNTGVTLQVGSVANGVRGNDQIPVDTTANVALVAGTGPTAAQGTLTLNANGTFTFVPAGGFVGTVTFQYDLNNVTTGGTSRATVTIVVSGPPVAVPDQVTTPEDTPRTFNPVANDTDPNNDPLTLQSVVSFPIHGTVTQNADGTLTYDPDLNYNGPDAMTYRVCDIGNLCTVGTISITVTPVNDAPIAKDDLTETPEDVGVLVVVLSNDVEVDGEELSTNAILSSPSNGTAEIKSDGTVLYTPRENFVGQDAFIYQACDESNLCASATVFIEVTPVNDAPVAGDDATTTPSNTAVTVPVLANDSDVDGDELDVTRLLLQPENGTAVINNDGTIRYTPDTGTTGIDTFSYEVCDPLGACDTATVTIDVGVVNGAPDPADDAVTTAIDTPTTIDVLINDDDPDGDDLTVTQVGVPTSGTATIVDNEVFYTPGTGFTGTETFSYTVCDTAGACASANIVVTVIPEANRPPIASDDIRNTVTGVPVNIDAVENDVDPDGDELVVADIIDDPSHGEAVIESDGSVTYTPEEGFVGTDVFEVRIEDGNGGFDTSYVTVVVTPTGNRKPDAINDQYDVTDEQDWTLAVLANDVDPDGDQLFIIDVVQPLQGTVSVQSGGGQVDNARVLIYSPNDGASGTDTFTYTVSDGRGGFDTATVTLIFPGSNHPPVALGDIVTTPEDVAVLIVVLSNDTDEDGDDLEVARITIEPRHGTAEILDDGSVLYTPDQHYVGNDSFEYQACDPGNLCDKAVVSLTVLPQNDPPLAGDDFVSVPANEASIIEVTLNDADPELDPLTVSRIVEQPDNGTVFVNPDGTVTFEPDDSFLGTDSFVYEVCDPDEACDTATVTVFVGTSNDNPTPQDDEATTDEETAVNIDVLENDADPDGDDLEIGTVEDPLHGEAVIEDDNTITYTPDPDFVGEEIFFYTACDPSGACSTAFVVVEVLEATNVPPVAVDDIYTTVRDEAITFDTRLNDFDLDGDPITVIGTTEPDNGTAQVLSNGTIRYTPDPGFVGVDHFTVTITDGNGGTSTQTVTVTVTETANQPPRAEDDSYPTVPSDRTTILTVRDNDSDPDGDDITIVDVEQPEHAVVTITPEGDLEIDPDGSYIGPDRFCYTITDGNGAYDEACVDVIIGDRDGDGLGDGHEVEITGTDPDDPDSDEDGLRDGDEVKNGDDPKDYDPGDETNPLDADTDDDGIRDGDEVNGEGPNEPYGPTDPLDTDSDDDGIEDGIEEGVDLPVPDGVSEGNDVPIKGTDVTVWDPDLDPESETDPNDDDTDDDGIKDGTEDANGNGRWDGEVVGTGDQSDPDGETDPTEVDTDGDGIQDGTELGLTDPEGEDTDLGIFRPDLDPDTSTDPLDIDTDDGGVPDGGEDLNFNGWQDPGEIDPNWGIDDSGVDGLIAEGGGCSSSQGGLIGIGLAAMALLVLLRRRRVS